MSNDSRDLSKTRSRHLDASEDSLSPAMEELAIALAPIVPDPALRLTMVYQCFRSEPDAPYILALQALTGAALPVELASDIWRLTLETQHRWSERLGEVVSLKSAAIDASDRYLSRNKTGKPDPEATGSIRDYLDRDLATGLYQRSSYDTRVREEVARASAKEPVALVFIQLEGVGAVSKSVGDGALEDIYRNVGEVMRHHFRDGDLPCRYGADYFVALLPHTTAARAHTVAEGLIPALQQTLRGTPITASIGLAVSPEAGASAAALENAAGAALNDARARGPWNIATYSPPLTAPTRSGSWGQLVGAGAALIALGAVVAGGCAYLNHHSADQSPAVAPAVAPAAASGGAVVTSTMVANPPTPAPAAAPAPSQDQGQQGHTAPRVFAPGQYGSGSFSTPIAAYYKRHGKVELGHVYDNGPGAAVHTWKVGDYTAEVQDFKGGKHKELDVFATNNGAYEINNVHGFWTYYIHTGSLGHYGLPLNNEHRSGRGQYRQDFQNSSLIWNPRTGIWEQHRALSGTRM